MPDYDPDTNEAGERAQQQLRDLANAVRNAARNLNSAYPDTTKGDRIIRRYQQETQQIVQRGRQRTDRSIGASSSQPARAGSSSIAPEVVGVLLLFSAFVLLGLFIAAVFLFAPLGLFWVVSLGAIFVLIWFLTRDFMVAVVSGIAALFVFIGFCIPI
jgi:ABC-type multidrug transport system fused ATPase/permease subunit